MRLSESVDSVISLYKILRNIDHEISHLFKFIYCIDEVNACLIVLCVMVKVFYLFVAEIVPELVDSVLGIIGI